jgi:hypothetical protein
MSAVVAKPEAEITAADEHLSASPFCVPDRLRYV